MAVLLSTAVLTWSCSDDDDDHMNGTEAVANATLLDSKTGLRLKSISTRYWTLLDFDYDAKGNVKAFGIEGEVYEISGNKWRCDDDYDNLTMNVTFNSAGYLTELSYNSPNSYGGQSTGKITCSYSGNYLKSASSSGSYTEKKDGKETYSESWSNESSLTWSGDKLQKIECSEKWKDDYDQGSDRETINYEYENRENYNKYGQVPVCIGEALCEIGDGVGYLACAGILGKGPAYLPVGAKSVEIDSDGDKDEDEMSYSYSFNDDGTIDRESIDGWGTYHYSDVYYYSYVSNDDDYDYYYTSARQLVKQLIKKQTHRERVAERKAKRKK